MVIALHLHTLGGASGAVFCAEWQKSPERANFVLLAKQS